MRFEFYLVSTLRRVGSPSSELRRDRVGHSMVDWLWQWDVNVITVRSLSNLWMMGGNGKQVRGCLIYTRPLLSVSDSIFLHLDGSHWPVYSIHVCKYGTYVGRIAILHLHLHLLSAMYSGLHHLHTRLHSTYVLTPLLVPSTQ